MSLTSESMTPADIAAVTGNRANSGFGNDGFGLWWIINSFSVRHVQWRMGNEWRQ